MNFTEEQASAARFIRDRIVQAKRDVLAGKYGPITAKARRAAEQFVRDAEAADRQREVAR